MEGGASPPGPPSSLKEARQIYYIFITTELFYENLTKLLQKEVSYLAFFQQL
jgi:hypothetical protein